MPPVPRANSESNPPPHTHTPISVQSTLWLYLLGRHFLQVFRLHLVPISSKCPIKGLHLCPFTVVSVLLYDVDSHCYNVGCHYLSSSLVLSLFEAWADHRAAVLRLLERTLVCFPETCHRIHPCLPSINSHELSGSKMEPLFLLCKNGSGLPRGEA